jgi:23S rRNA (adenine2030-N6)-methyltransferase
LNYDHAFHAGNPGDVLKHALLVGVIEELQRKEGPLAYVDTHAGAGEYALNSAVARKKAEYAQGVAPLWGRKDAPPLVGRYLAHLAKANPSGSLRSYPGSPAIARALQRHQDDLRLFELQQSDVRMLAMRQGRGPGVEVARADGYEALKAVLPPPTRRAATDAIVAERDRFCNSDISEVVIR